ncbi:LysR substrate-binding domain-containing protein [Chelativorans salis]|uniref:LysR substrate-binding domain-containing protein n=1 Tax=Chelativorans salis TaxID=2978478 RepID=A0ABT2LQB0_9HYPH|nr:LysR substrate-binding domain-containing protein [Chelativorans sp. EGI FJ00035]MCT7376682.1 LysR substrate-binding domain-containing protein [Chelativorans sp. EGI FJ00035]
MELRHLRYFVAVAEEGSITRAAERLGIQQPPLGQQLKALEAELGVQLFDRAPKRIALNAAGRVFLEEARAILSRTQEAVDHIRRFNMGESGTLSVGFTSSASLHALTPRLLGAFRQLFPLVQIAVEESETYELVLALQNSRIDVAFSHVATDDFKNLTSRSLGQEGMIVAMPIGHPLAQSGEGPLDIRALADEKIVVYRRPDGPGIFDGILKCLDQAGIRISISDQVSRMIAAINLVSAGRGLTIVPASMGILHRASVHYRPLIGDVIPPLPLYIAFRTNERLALVKKFVEVTSDMTKDAADRKMSTE